jgi:putative transposase
MHWLFEAKKRYALINYQRLMQLLNIPSVEELKKSHNGWVEEALRNSSSVRESKWVKSVAVGSKEFVEMTKEKLGFQVKGRSVSRSVSRSGDNYQLREQHNSLQSPFCP